MKGTKMTVSYLDTLASVEAASTDGLSYDSLTRAMKVHVRSLMTEGHVAAFIGDDQVALSEPGAVICLTADGVAYTELLRSSGLLAEEIAESPKPKRRKTRRRKTTTAKKTVPTPSESVTSPVLPKGEKARRVPGNQHGDQLWIPTPKELDANKKIEDLERKVSALMAVLAS